MAREGDAWTGFMNPHPQKPHLTHFVEIQLNWYTTWCKSQSFYCGLNQKLTWLLMHAWTTAQVFKHSSSDPPGWRDIDLKTKLIYKSIVAMYNWSKLLEIVSGKMNRSPGANKKQRRWEVRREGKTCDNESGKSGGIKLAKFEGRWDRLHIALMLSTMASHRWQQIWRSNVVW